MAERDGIPVYVIFTNDQLEKMVTGRMTSLTDLKSIEGIGEARLERYAKDFLPLLEKLMKDGKIIKDEESQPTVSSDTGSGESEGSRLEGTGRETSED